ncbi:MAG: type II secretion system F family protein [Elusimicrobium sp.]|jgi:tight adherence protein C|nr:type II secretion system F family protein [Elusimicrobium sp.]
MSSGVTLFLEIVLILGSLGLFAAVLALLTPEEKGMSVSDIEARRVKTSSSFARLDQKTLWGRFCLYILEAFKLEKELEEQHILLGSPEKPQPVDMLIERIIYAIVLPLIFFLLFRTWFVIFLVPAAFYVPYWIINSRIQKRQRDMLGNFSTTVDLTALIIESGLDYMTAFDRIIKIAREKTILEEELGKMLNEVKLGYSRREALERMASRTGVQEIRSFVSLIVQSDELGTSLVDLLRNFSIDLRVRRMNKAEKLAAQASTKMLIPLFIFIFPTVFILILVPMVKDIMSSGGLGF